MKTFRTLLLVFVALAILLCCIVTFFCVRFSSKPEKEVPPHAPSDPSPQPLRGLRRVQGWQNVLFFHGIMALVLVVFGSLLMSDGVNQLRYDCPLVFHLSSRDVTFRSLEYHYSSRGHPYYILTDSLGLEYEIDFCAIRVFDDTDFWADVERGDALTLYYLDNRETSTQPLSLYGICSEELCYLDPISTVDSNRENAIGLLQMSYLLFLSVFPLSLYHLYFCYAANTPEKHLKFLKHHWKKGLLLSPDGTPLKVNGKWIQDGVTYYDLK